MNFSCIITYIYDQTVTDEGINVFQGCTFLAIFGLPGFKHENDCAHALQCSFRMKSELDKVPQIV